MNEPDPGLPDRREEEGRYWLDNPRNVDRFIIWALVGGLRRAVLRRRSLRRSTATTQFEHLYSASIAIFGFVVYASAWCLSPSGCGRFLCAQRTTTTDDD